MDTPSRLNAIEGTFDEYNELDNFVKNNDMSIQANYEIVKQNVNIQNYVDYMIFGVFCGNRDWYENNTKWMKPKAPGHKWEWMMWDIEYGLGTYKNYDHGQPNWAAIYYARTRGGWPYSGTWKNTYFFRNLLDNKEFRDYFSTRYADLLNTTLKEENILAKINETKQLLAPDFDKQIARWGLSNSTWESAISYLEYYVSERPYYARKNLNEKVLNLYSDSLFADSIQTIYLDVQPFGAGKIKINTIHPEAYPWNGKYFNSIPVQVTAIPNPGYQFSHWSEDTIDADWFSHMLLEDASFTAFFEAEEAANINDIVINEISYNQHASWETGDWIELKNASNNAINLENWYILDEDNSHKYTLPAKTIAANGYIVIATDSLILQTYHPAVSNLASGLSFGLASGGDAIRLYDSNNQLIDAVYYDNKSPWPLDADGKGPTLELDRNTNQNSIAANWFTYLGEYGTPGAINHLRTGIDDIESTTLSVAPNPFNNYIQIYGATQNSTWTITNLQGQLIATGIIDTKSFGLDLTLYNMPNGTYLLQVESENERTVLPITKLNR